jgi:hypothetical protein
MAKKAKKAKKSFVRIVLNKLLGKRGPGRPSTK